MSEGILLYFYTEPGRITSLGRFLNWLSSVLFLSAAVGHFVTTASNILPKHPGQLQTAKTLADIYPSLPLWWVPESFPGLALVVPVFIAGIYLTSYGKRLDRHLRS
jgi:hypothetical protein